MTVLRTTPYCLLIAFACGVKFFSKYIQFVFGYFDPVIIIALTININILQGDLSNISARLRLPQGDSLCPLSTTLRRLIFLVTFYVRSLCKFSCAVRKSQAHLKAALDDTCATCGRLAPPMLRNGGFVR